MGKAKASHKSVYRLVRKLGFRWKRGVKRLNKKDPQARAAFAPTIQRLADEASQGLRTLIYVDEAHIHCDLDEGYGWAWGGKPYEILSSSPALSQKISLYGAFVFNDPEVVLWKAPRCNTMFTLAFLFHLRKVLGDVPKPTVVWDGAPWHKPRWLLRIAEVIGFELVLLPAYSPDFMPVEALWRWLREDVTRNHCHDSVEELVADVVEFGKRINADPLGLIQRLWPKLELRESELPKGEFRSAEDVLGKDWVSPLPQAIQAALGEGEPRPDQGVLRLTDEEWDRIEPLLPKPTNRRGTPRAPRALVEAALWRERNGAPWRDLPEVYAPHQTAQRNYARWRDSGLWDAIRAALEAARAPPALGAA